MAQSKSDKPTREFTVVAHKQSFDKANEWLKKAREEALREENKKDTSDKVSKKNYQDNHNTKGA